MNDIELLKYKISYNINETSRYTPIIGVNEEFDEIPDNSKDDNNNLPKNDNEIDNVKIPSSPVPNFDKNNNLDTNINDKPINDINNNDESVDEIQNDIIKNNIQAMKDIKDELDKIVLISNILNDKVDKLSIDVDEVREPTNGEKLKNSKYVTYPYSYNLNDVWNNNWYEEKNKDIDDDGIRKLSDGTYEAKYDDLKKNINNIDDTF